MGVIALGYVLSILALRYSHCKDKLTFQAFSEMNAYDEFWHLNPLQLGPLMQLERWRLFLVSFSV